MKTFEPKIWVFLRKLSLPSMWKVHLALTQHYDKSLEQAGAELCQAQLLTKLTASYQSIMKNSDWYLKILINERETN